MQCVRKLQLIEGRLCPFVQSPHGPGLVRVAWAPLPGSQEAYFACMDPELLLHGPRGTGKSIAQIAKHFFVYVGKGYGSAARMLLLRRSMPQVGEIIKLARELFAMVCPEAKFNEMKSTFTFPGGETLWISHFNSMLESSNFLGQSFPCVMFEELSDWPDAGCYRFMQTTNRSPVPGMPRLMSATTNPLGVGKNWIQQYYRLLPGDFSMIGDIINDARNDDNSVQQPRRAIRSYMDENLYFKFSDPKYRDKVIQAAQGSEAEYKAYVLGDWGFSAGGMFDDIWANARQHVVIPQFDPPPDWRVYPALDFGTSKPGAVLWWTISNGDDIEFPNGRVMNTLKGDIFIIDELYFWTGKANEGTRTPAAEQARKIVEHHRERFGDMKLRFGPADAQIFSDDLGESIAEIFRKNGVRWDPAPKGKNSRALGWHIMRSRILASVREQGDVRTDKGLFVTENCKQWLRTVPTLQRDMKNNRFDDVDDESEDHCGDCTRYLLVWEPPILRSGRLSGI